MDHEVEITPAQTALMQLEMSADLARSYRSPSQRARIVTEAWGRTNLYCPACSSVSVRASDVNTQVVDFVCPDCAADFQLKSQSHPFTRRIVDSAYEPMRRAVERSETPHLLILHYDRVLWRVVNLTLIPSFTLTVSCIEKRKPLGPTARRKGWVGCNILLFRIPMDARIALVHQGAPATPDSVRSQFRRLLPLKQLPSRARGWTLDVLNVIRSLDRGNFGLKDVYDHAEDLQALHPNNRHVREKIRQQLQRLRDMGLVHFQGHGQYSCGR